MDSGKPAKPGAAGILSITQGGSLRDEIFFFFC